VSDEDQRVATYEYDGLFRRCEKTVANQGIGVVNKSDVGGITGIQAGNLHERYYYSGWRLVEVRNASDQVLGQFVYGTQYIDEPLRYDRNTDVGTDDDCLDEGSAAYFYHQDANYRVVMLTDENADVVERYEYTAYGEPTILGGYSSSAAAELGNALLVSTVGNPLMHQGLFRDGEIGSYQNRNRQLAAPLGRFMQRDPLGYVAGINAYQYALGQPLSRWDPTGRQDGAVQGAGVTVAFDRAVEAADAAIALIGAAATVEVAWHLYFLALDAIARLEDFVSSLGSAANVRMRLLRAAAEAALERKLQQLAEAAEEALEKGPKVDPEPRPRRDLGPDPYPPRPRDPDDRGCAELYKQYKEDCNKPFSCDGINDATEIENRMHQAAKCLNGRITYRSLCVDTANESAKDAEGHLEAIRNAKQAYDKCRDKLGKCKRK
jgi:RHS repeat-associated protein